MSFFDSNSALMHQYENLSPEDKQMWKEYGNSIYKDIDFKDKKFAPVIHYDSDPISKPFGMQDKKSPELNPNGAE